MAAGVLNERVRGKVAPERNYLQKSQMNAAGVLCVRFLVLFTWNRS